MDQIRSELASLRQAVGKNRAADDSARLPANGQPATGEAVPGTNMV